MVPRISAHKIARVCAGDTSMLALVATAIPSLTAGECAAGLVGLGFNFGLVERYGEWFDNNSSVSMTHGSHICSLCRGGRLRTEPALAAVDL